MEAYLYMIIKLVLIVACWAMLARILRNLYMNWKGVRYARVYRAMVEVGMIAVVCWGVLEFLYQRVWYKEIYERASWEVPGHYYKAASFKSWLMYDTLDTYYTPPRLSKAVFMWKAEGEIGKDTLEILNLAGYQLRDLVEGTAILGSDGFGNRSLKITERAPENKPWEVDYSRDINEFVEGLDLRKLAARCYEGKPGRIFFLPGLRDIAGDVGGGMDKLERLFLTPSVANQPARIITEDNLELSLLMENIWLLYQLTIDGWVKLDGEGKLWKWSEQAMSTAKTEGDRQTLANLPQEVRKRYKVIDILCENSRCHSVPPIPCSVRKTKEKVRTEDSEIRIMRGNEPGTVVRFVGYRDIEVEKDILQDYKPLAIFKWYWSRMRWFAADANKTEYGQEIDIGKGRQRYSSMLKDGEYADDRSVAQYVQYSLREPLKNGLSMKIGNAGNKIRDGKVVPPPNVNQSVGFNRKPIVEAPQRIFKEIYPYKE